LRVLHLTVNYGIIKVALKKITNVQKVNFVVLLLNQFSSHTNDYIKEKNKNIKLIYVPKGLTCKYQSLDVLINGTRAFRANTKTKSKKKLWKEVIAKKT